MVRVANGEGGESGDVALLAPWQGYACGHGTIHHSAHSPPSTPTYHPPLTTLHARTTHTQADSPMDRKRRETRRSEVVRNVTSAASFTYGRKLTTRERSSSESVAESSSTVNAVHGRKKSSDVSGGACDEGPAWLARPR